MQRKAEDEVSTKAEILTQTMKSEAIPANMLRLYFETIRNLTQIH